MQPLLHLGASLLELEKCNPYYSLALLEPQKCNPYWLLGLRGIKYATPIAFLTLEN